MIYLIAIIYFVVITYLLGFSASYFTRYKTDDAMEGFFMRMALGLAIIPLLTIIFSWLKIIEWKSYLLVSIIVPIIAIFTRKETEIKIKPGLKKKHIYTAIAIFLFAATLFIHIKGAFMYPYLEDGDPLSHALAARYVSETHTYATPVDARVTHYLEPYPPFFSSLVGIHLTFTEHNVIWALKVLNAILVSLSTIFMFYLVRKITGSSAKGAVGAFTILAINSYLSHFIFSAGWATTMIIPAIYFILVAEDNNAEKKTKKEKIKFKELFKLKGLNWGILILAGILISSVLLIQPITSGIFGLFLFIYFLTKIGRPELMKKVFIMILIGLLFSFLFWVPAIAKYGINTTAEVMGFGMFLNAEKGLDNDSSGGVIYSFKDFMVAPQFNKIDQPTGVGTVLFLTFLASIAFLIGFGWKLWKKYDENKKVFFALIIWTAILTILIMGNGLDFPYKFVPHRLWSYFSIGVVILTIIGGSALLGLIKQREIKIAIVMLFIIGVYITSLVPKYQVQTSIWPPGPEFKTQDELIGYISLQQNIPINTKIFSLCGIDEKVAGSNMAVAFRNKEINALKNNYDQMLQQSYQITSALYNAGIQYIIIDSECAINKGVNETNQVLQSLRTKGFTPVFGNNGFVLLKVP